MGLYQAHTFDIPAETIKVAQAAFPKGNIYLLIRDKLGPLFKDSDFAALFDWRGQTGVSPALLASVTIMQYMEGLTDRQAADAVRGRIDWKYHLGLALTDTGFHYSILSPFRERLLEGGQASLLFEQVLQRLKAHGLLTGYRQQRTDSTHVLAAIRSRNRLELVGETLRRVLDDVARVAPEWLVAQVTPDWFDRYGARLEAYRLPHKPVERAALQTQIGQDGQHLLTVIEGEQALPWLRQLPAVEVLRQVWSQQYAVQDGQLQWRAEQQLPPHKELIVSPDDREARNRTKRDTNWNGYVVHLTETCTRDTLHLITHVETTPATTADIEVTDTIHQALLAKELPPEEHLVDTAYVSAAQLLHSQEQQIDLIGPVPGDKSWQAQQGSGFAGRCFGVDWAKQTVTCPQGKTNQSWHPRQAKNGDESIEVRFRPSDCQACAQQTACTKSKRGVRVLSLRPQATAEIVQAARERQETVEFKTKYNKRAGIEGTISQGVRAFDLRRCRYLGLAKSHLQHLATATAINLTRTVQWWLAGETRNPVYRSPFLKLKPAIST